MKTKSYFFFFQELILKLKKKILSTQNLEGSEQS